MTEQNFSGIIFDIDGTLLDSLDVWAKADEIFLSKLGIEYDKMISNDLKKLHFTSASQYFIDKFNLKMSLQEVMDSIIEIVRDQYLNEVKLKPFVKEYIDQEYKKGTKMCVATSNSKELAVMALENAGIKDKLLFILTSDDVQCGKEDPLIFHKSAEMLGLKESEIIVFEDSLHATLTTTKAGFYTVGIYDSHSDYEFDDLKNICNRTIKSFEEMLDEN